MIRAIAPLAIAPLLIGCFGDPTALAQCQARLTQLELERTTYAAQISARFAEEGVNVDPASATPDQLTVFADMQTELQVRDNKLAGQRGRCNDLAGKP